MVLKSTIPSVLIETAFISNPDEERKLRDRAFQQRMAKSIFSGLKRSAPRLLARRGTGSEAVRAAASVHTPISSTQTAQAVPASGAREHIVKPGETLSAIARLYDIHVEALRFLNGIQGSDLAVGTKLQVPTRGGEL